LSGYRTYVFSLAAVIFIQLLSIAICAEFGRENICTKPSRRFGHDGRTLRGGCGCPVDTSSFQEASRIRSSFVSLLSNELAVSRKELKVSLLFKSEGKSGMKKESSLSQIDTLRNPEKIELDERIRRAEERIKLAKKYIYEQELSAKLEHLKMRKKQAEKSRS